MPPNPKTRLTTFLKTYVTPSDYALGWVLLAGVALLYLWTLDTGLRPDELTGGDLITHQYAQVQARPSNAPGYPLFTMLGWLWYRLGRLTLDFALNPVQILSLYSTLWGLASVWILYRLLLRPEFTAGNLPLSALLTAFYAVSYFFWYYSVTTEQYSSAIFQTLLIVWFALQWERAPSDRHLLWLAFISGTMLANMLTTLFIIPPLFYLIFTRRWRILLNLKLVALTVITGFLPALSYAYVYIRGAQHPEWRGAGQWNSPWDWFVAFVSTQQGRDELAPGLTLVNVITPEFPSLMWQELTWPILLAGLLGWALLGRRLAIFFFGTALVYLPFLTAYRFGNWFQVVLPLYPLFVLGAGRTCAWLWHSQPFRQGPAKWRLKPGSILLIGLLLGLVGYRFQRSFSPTPLTADQSHRPGDTALYPGWAVLTDVEQALTAAELLGDASLLDEANADDDTPISVGASFTEWLALQYLLEIWQVEPSRPLSLAPPGQPADLYTAAALAAAPSLRPSEGQTPLAFGEVVYFGAQGLPALPHFAKPSNLSFGQAIRLRGYAFTPTDLPRLTLFWETLAPLEADYTVSVRLWREGQLLHTAEGPAQRDHIPVWGFNPTTRWPVGPLIADGYSFPPLPARPTQVQIVLYRPTPNGFENLAVQVLDLGE